MPVYSFSKINLFKQCQLKFRYKYIDKYPDGDIKSLELALWSAVHGTLEYLYSRIRAMDIPSVEKCLDIFESLWKAQAIDQIPFTPGKDPIDYYRRWQAYIKHYYYTYTPFDQDQTISLEDRTFSFELSNGIRFTGVIDRLAKKDSNFIIIDYKTGQKLPTMQETDYVEQLTLYAHGVRQKYNHYHTQIHAKLIYLHFDLEDTWVITNDSIDEIVDQYSQIIWLIQNKAGRYAFGDESAFQPQEWSYCRFCAYQQICPLFNHLQSEDIVLQDTTIKNIIDEYVQQSQQIKKLKYSKEYKKQLIISYLKQFPTLRLHGHKHRISIGTVDTYQIQDHEKASQILDQLWILDQVLKIDPHLLTRLIKDHTVQYVQLNNSVIKKQTTVLRAIQWE